jgi:E3 ubiquitin-protein ligase SHPRH
MERALLALGFDARGVTVDERLLDPVLLRSWIRKLRGICTHPQVGQLQSSTEKGTLKSIEEVLDVSSPFRSVFPVHGDDLGIEHARD